MIIVAMLGLDKLLYNHDVVENSAKEFVNEMASTNSIENVWAILKRDHHGIFHYFSVKHATRHVDEFACRLMKTIQSFML